MVLNPNYALRFYIRNSKDQGEDSQTPLRVRVWMSVLQKYLYLSTKTTASKRQWSRFDLEGNPSAGADPKIIKAVDSYRAAVNMVVSSAIINGTAEALTSDQLSLLVEGVISRMEANMRMKSGTPRPISVFTNPVTNTSCDGCIFRSPKCKAKWRTQLEADNAADLASLNGTCPMKQVDPESDPRVRFFDGIFANAEILQGLNPKMEDKVAMGLAFLDLVDYYKAHKKSNKDNGKEVTDGNE